MASNALDVRAPSSIVCNSSLFWASLKMFHSDLGSKIRVPVIAGKEIDLHLLYMEVTKKGGYDRVVSEKKWKEVSTTFMLPPTATSASHMLKKHYFKTLYKYEQVYYSGLPRSPLEPGMRVTFKTEGQFDGGYLVSTTVDSKVYKGILLRVQDEPSAPPATTSTAVAPSTPTAIAPPRMIKRKRDYANRI